MKLLEFDTLDSTNRYLLDLAKAGEEPGTAVWAHKQTGGRGRLGRSFSSPAGGIYVSILVPLADPSARGSQDGIYITAMAGVAVMRTIKQVCGRNCGIKWVNDIIYKGRKVCGILAQAYGGNPAGNTPDKAVIGIGVNYRTDMSELPEDVREIACSLYGPDEEAPAEHTFVKTLLDNLWNLITGAGTTDRDDSWLAEYKASSTIVGNKVLILKAGAVTGEGLATEIDDSCRLHVVGEDGKETVLSTGEVSIRKA